MKGATSQPVPGQPVTQDAGGFRRILVDEEMPARPAGGGQVIAFLAPDSRHIEQLSHQAGSAPEGERRACDAAGEVGGIQVEIDRSARALNRQSTGRNRCLWQPGTALETEK